MTSQALSNASPSTLEAPSSGGTMVSVDGKTLPLEHTRLKATAGGGIARVTLEQTFSNPYDSALEVTYQLPLPADGAVSGFSFQLGAVEVVGEVDARNRARERYEAAIASGHTAALLEQDRSSVFTQKVGNIPPGETLIARVVVDQKLAWLDEGSWEWRFPTVVGARYMGESGRVRDAAKMTVSVADGPLPNRLSLGLAIRDVLPKGASPGSVSHALAIEPDDDNATFVTLRAREGSRLDRDVVVRWPVVTPDVGLSARVHRDSVREIDHALLTIVPPARAAKRVAVPRDLIVLIDTSGSMSGRPLDQARRVVRALIQGMSEQDQLEMIEFSNSPTRWNRKAVAMTTANRRAADVWVQKLQANGGTEMASAVKEALKPLRKEAQRQVVILTDGYIGFEDEILRIVLESLPARCRFHAVGIGCATNRTLTAHTPRAGRGVELIVDLDEDAEKAATRLLSRTAEPLVTELSIEGEDVIAHAPEKLPDLYAGAPVLIPLQVKRGATTVTVRGMTAQGPFTLRTDLRNATVATGELSALFGRERVEDLEMKHAMGRDTHAIDREIEQTGIRYQIATRLTSWVAITREVMVDPDTSRVKQTQPQEIPYGTSVEGMGLRPSATVELEADEEFAAFAELGGEAMDGPVFDKNIAREEVDRKEEKADVWFSRMQSEGGALDAKPKAKKRAAAASSTDDDRVEARKALPVAPGAAPQRAPADISTATRSPVPMMSPSQASAPLSPQAAPSTFPAKRSRSSLLTLLLVLIVLALVTWLTLWLLKRNTPNATVQPKPVPTSTQGAPRT